MAGPSHELQRLPKTIEGATNRYLSTYEKRFQGPVEEMRRLKMYAEARILKLRKKAPNFYEEKLPTLVNQAASTLLSCETDSTAGKIKFNDTHRHFLLVLDELAKSQPAGDVDFQKERERAKEREELKKRHLYLRERIERLEAIEFTNDDIGEDDDASSYYMKTISEIDRLKLEMKDVVVAIAVMEGEKLDEGLKFELKVRRGSVLERLGESKLKHLEEQITQFLTEHKHKRRAIYFDKSIIAEMIEKLNIDTSKFTKQELLDIQKDALDAYKDFHRDRENERREEYFESLLKNKYLRPKEGIILESPDDVPEDVKARLEQSEIRSKRRLDEFMEEFLKRPGADEENAADLIEDGQESDDDILVSINENCTKYARIKEEPRDDYDNDVDSSDELMVNEDIAERIQESKLRQNNLIEEEDSDAENYNNTNGNDSDISDYHDAGDSDADNSAELNGSRLDQSTHPQENGTVATEEEAPSQEMYQLPSYKQVASDLDKLFDSFDEDGPVEESHETNKSKPPPTRPAPGEKSQKRCKLNPKMKRPNGDDDLQMLGVVEPNDKIDEVILIDSDEDD